MESVRAYETGQRIPPNDVVEDMVVCYDYQRLAFQHLHETNTLATKVVPQLEERTLLETAIRIYNRLRRLEKGGAVERLLDIAEDGQIDNEERPGV